MKPKSIYFQKEAFLVILVFLIANYGIRLITEFTTLNLYAVWQRLMYIYGWEISIILIVGAVWFRKELFSKLGLDGNILKGLVIAFICCLPMLIGYFLIGKFLPETLTFWNVLSHAVLPAFSEELLFRGFLFGLLFRYFKWGFIPAACMSAFIFGIGHLWQGINFFDTLGIMVVTSMGGLWFAWLFAEWNYNLWLVIFLHLLMNLYWGMFEITNTNALGGLDSNIFRAITIIISVVWTIRMAKNRNHFEINANRLI